MGSIFFALASHYHNRKKHITIKYSYGDIYEGDWIDGKRAGKGTYKYADGNIYEGDWKDGKRRGKGTFKFANGDIYEGSWSDNCFQGIRKLITSTETYTGYWETGKKSGEGMLILQDKHAAYETIDGEPLRYEISDNNSQEIVHHYLGG